MGFLEFLRSNVGIGFIQSCSYYLLSVFDGSRSLACLWAIFPVRMTLFPSEKLCVTIIRWRCRNSTSSHLQLNRKYTDDIIIALYLTFLRSELVFWIKLKNYRFREKKTWTSDNWVKYWPRIKMNALPFASNRREQSAVCLFVCLLFCLLFFAKLYDAQFRSVSGVVAPPHPTPYALARRWRNMRNGRGFRPSFNAWSLSLGQLPQSVTWFSRITWMKN